MNVALVAPIKETRYNKNCVYALKEVVKNKAGPYSGSEKLKVETFALWYFRLSTLKDNDNWPKTIGRLAKDNDK